MPYLTLILCGLSACGAGPAVLGSDRIPVRRVVLYRNGVAYFERQGRVSGEELTFGVRQQEVGDFLSSLAAFEQSSGGVSSVSFEVPDNVRNPPPSTSSDGTTPPHNPANDRVAVRLRLGTSGEHDLTVAYVVGAPIWRPSYRVLIEGDRALLQAWAVVQNISGEDWRNVDLSLTTGAPIAFRSDLGTPITPERPFVTDRGEVIAAVPLSENTIANQPVESPSPVAEAAEMFGDEGDSDAVNARESQRRTGGAPGRSRSRSQSGVSVRPQFSLGLLEQSMNTAASTASLGDGVTRYDISQRVTVPDGGSTMVAILSRRIPGEDAHLFAPNGGVPLSYQHPFRVVRLVNDTGAVLERGTISVLGPEGFLGQGVLEPLSRNASSFVPFALDRTVAVESASEFGEAQGRLVRVFRGRVMVERFAQRTTRYKARNGGEHSTRVYIKHERMPGAELFNPPTGTETTPTGAILLMTVNGRAESELQVVERTPVQREMEFISAEAAEAVQLYLSGPAVDAAQGPALRRALALRAQLSDVQTRLAAAERERNVLTQQVDQTRENLNVARRVQSAQDLVARLVQRMSDLDSRLAAATRSVLDLQTTQSELTVRLSEALQDVTLDVPAPVAAPAAASPTR